ncbi:hypothetical protein D3C80_1379530 [compost metagenome]
MVEPAHAAAITIEQARFVQNENAGAKPDNGSACRRPLFEEPQRLRRQGAVIADQAAGNDDIVVMPGVDQPCVGLHLHTTARLNAAHGCRQHRPFAENWARAVGLVGGKAQHIDEIREGRQCETVGKQESDAEAFLGAVRGHGANIHAKRRDCPAAATQIFIAFATRVFLTIGSAHDAF